MKPENSGAITPEPEFPGFNVTYNQTLVQTNIGGFPAPEVVHTLEHYCPGVTREMVEMAKIGHQALIESNKDAMARTQSDIRWTLMLSFFARLLNFSMVLASLGSSLYSIKIGASPIVSCALAGWAVGKGLQETVNRLRH